MSIQTHTFDVIIVGGSYSGLSAAMTLGRSLRKTLIIDSGLPCNRFTPHSHNFITHGGAVPQSIATAALEQVLKYKTVTFKSGLAVSGLKTLDGFRIATADGQVYSSRKLLFATGVKDALPTIEGLEECWGKTVIHCPYCHGFEFSQQATAILANGAPAIHYAQLLKNLTDHLTILTNGPAIFTDEEKTLLTKNGISINEAAVQEIHHQNGIISSVGFSNGSTLSVSALYYGPAKEQHCKIPEQLGCTFNEQGLLTTDAFQMTTVDGVYACGDNSSPFRTVSMAVSSGTMAGAGLNKCLVEEDF